jgi:hypothetical protein
VVEVEPAAGDPVRAQQVEELAAAAADVEHVGGASKERQVGLEPATNLVLRSAKPILEPDVLPRIELRPTG